MITFQLTDFFFQMYFSIRYNTFEKNIYIEEGSTIALIVFPHNRMYNRHLKGGNEYNSRIIIYIYTTPSCIHQEDAENLSKCP